MLKRVSKKPTSVEDIFASAYNKTLSCMEQEWKASIVTYLQHNKSEVERLRPLTSAQRHFFNKNYDAALLDIAVSLGINDRDPYVLYLEGRCHFFKNSLDQAADSFLKAVALSLLRKEDDFAYSNSYLYLGKIFDLKGEREKAMKFYSRVLGYSAYHDQCDKAIKYLQVPFKKEGKNEPL